MPPLRRDALDRTLQTLRPEAVMRYIVVRAPSLENPLAPWRFYVGPERGWSSESRDACGFLTWDAAHAVALAYAATVYRVTTY